jgi:hypothetical protein
MPSRPAAELTIVVSGAELALLTKLRMRWRFPAYRSAEREGLRLRGSAIT